MSHSSRTFLAFLTGIATGAALGILYAPAEGSATRNRLSYRLAKYREQLQRLIADLVKESDLPESLAKTEGKKVVDEAREKAEQLLSGRGSPDGANQVEVKRFGKVWKKMSVHQPLNCMSRTVFFLLFAASFSMISCKNKQGSSQELAVPGQAPVMAFAEQEANLGRITEGDTLRHRFEFTNTGKTPLTVQSAVASCGCTVPSFPKESIAPGGKGSIDVVFNSKNKTGMNTKTVTVYANTQPDMNTVAFKVEVLPQPEKK